MKLGACHVETPFIEFGQLSTVLYFGYFIIIVPILSLIENTLIESNFQDFGTENEFNKALVNSRTFKSFSSTSPMIFKRSFHSTSPRGSFFSMFANYVLDIMSNTGIKSDFAKISSLPQPEDPKLPLHKNEGNKCGVDLIYERMSLMQMERHIDTFTDAKKCLESRDFYNPSVRKALELLLAKPEHATEKITTYAHLYNFNFNVVRNNGIQSGNVLKEFQKLEEFLHNNYLNHKDFHDLGYEINKGRLTFEEARAIRMARFRPTKKD